MQTRGATTSLTNQTSATDALIALVRLLARQTARECLGQTPAPPETTNDVDRRAASDASPRTLARQRNRSPARSLGEDGVASERRPVARANPNAAK